MADTPEIHNPLMNMMVLNSNRTRRVSSWDREGGNSDFLTLHPGGTTTIFDVQGPGIVNHFYVTLMSRDLFVYRRAVLRMFWDDEESPSVEVPIGDFFGVPFSRPQFFQSAVLSVNPGRDRLSTEGLNAYFPMPFAKRARWELFNDSDAVFQNFWYHVNYENVTGLRPDLGYFHACWHRENPCEEVAPPPAQDQRTRGPHVNLTGDENYVILDAQGRGNYAGCILQIDNLRHGWYGEGDDMIFIDGEKWPPSLHGTGTEEIFGGGACPNEPFFTPYCGFHLVENPDFFGQNAMYKFFINDPVRFQQSIRVTIEHGHANNLGNDYTSVAYWYQKEPHVAFAPLPSAEARLPRMPDEIREIMDRGNESAVEYTALERNPTLPPADRWALRTLYFKTKRSVYNRDVNAVVENAKVYFEAGEALRKKV